MEPQTGQIVPDDEITPGDQTPEAVQVGTTGEQNEADVFEDRVMRGLRLGYAGVKINVWEILSHISFVSGANISALAH